MKVLVSVVCVAFLVSLAHGLSEEQKEKIRNVHKECQADPTTHADEEDLKRAYKDENVVGTGPHFLCMSTKLGLQDVNGKVSKSSLKTKLSDVITDPVKLQEAVDKCSVEQATASATAEHILKCFHDYAGHVLHDHHHQH